jgi:hypothetical protein
MHCSDADTTFPDSTASLARRVLSVPGAYPTAPGIPQLAEYLQSTDLSGRLGGFIVKRAYGGHHRTALQFHCQGCPTCYPYKSLSSLAGKKGSTSPLSRLWRLSVLCPPSFPPTSARLGSLPRRCNQDQLC